MNGKGGWSEWQDSNLRPLRPEPGYQAGNR